MFDWGVLKRGVPESVRFCIGDLPMYTFLIPTHPYYQVSTSYILQFPKYSPDKILKFKVTTARSNQNHTMILTPTPPTNVPTKFQLPIP